MSQQTCLGEILLLLTSHPRHSIVSEDESGDMVINVKKWHLAELLSQHKANRFDQLDALQQVREVQKLDVTTIFEAGEMAFPQIVPLITRPEHVNEKIQTRENLENVVDGKKRFQLEWLSPLH